MVLRKSNKLRTAHKSIDLPTFEQIGRARAHSAAASGARCSCGGGAPSLARACASCLGKIGAARAIHEMFTLFVSISLSPARTLSQYQHVLVSTRVFSSKQQQRQRRRRRLNL